MSIIKYSRRIPVDTACAATAAGQTAKPQTVSGLTPLMNHRSVVTTLTIRHYLRFVEMFAQHFGKSPDKLGPDHLRTYQVYLLKERKLAPATVEHHMSALRFFFVRTLRRPEFREFLPYPRVQKKLPNILSKEEVARLINTSGSLFQRTFLMLLYSTGMRRSEVVRLTMLVMRSISFADHCMLETRTDMMRIYQFVTNCHSPKQPSFPTHLIAGRNP
jgi:site-specific recombinase XerD